jgi:Virulence factor membrane-bound polymerase, C-terminal/O-Antigen ligase/Protein glycosylation ligase
MQYEQTGSGLQPSAGIVGLVVVFIGYVFVYNTAPLPLLYQEVFTAAGWGALLLSAGLMRPGRALTTLGFSGKMALGLFAAYGIAVVLDQLFRKSGYPAIAMMHVLCMGLAGSVMVLGYQHAAHKGSGMVWVALVGAGVVNAVFGWAQYLGVHGWAGVIADLTTLGRIYGNLRQPNLYALLLACAVCGLCWWMMHMASQARSKAVGIYLLMVLVVGGIAASGSRAGGLFIWMVGLAGLTQRQAPFWIRMALLALPLMHLGYWATFVYVDSLDWLPFYSSMRSSLESAQYGAAGVSNSRVPLWMDLLQRLPASPWLGFGLGAVNPVLNADTNHAVPILNYLHAHHIFVHLAIEFGVLFAGGLGLAFCIWLWSLRKIAFAPGIVWILVAVLLVSIHSLLELPLWHLNYLLPFAYALGWISARADAHRAGHTVLAASSDESQAQMSPTVSVFVVAGVLAIAGAVHTVVDYRRIEPIYFSGKHLPPLNDRIVGAYQTFWFTHWVDQAVVGSILPGDDMVLRQCHLGKRVQSFFLGIHATMQMALSCYRAGELEKAVLLVQLAHQTDAEELSRFDDRLPPNMKDMHHQLLAKAGIPVR